MTAAGQNRVRNENVDGKGLDKRGGWGVGVGSLLTFIQLFRSPSKNRQGLAGPVRPVSAVP